MKKYIYVFIFSFLLMTSSFGDFKDAVRKVSKKAEVVLDKLGDLFEDAKEGIETKYDQSKEFIRDSYCPKVENELSCPKVENDFQDFEKYLTYFDFSKVNLSEIESALERSGDIMSLARERIENLGLHYDCEQIEALLQKAENIINNFIEGYSFADEISSIELKPDMNAGYLAIHYFPLFVASKYLLTLEHIATFSEPQADFFVPILCNMLNQWGEILESIIKLR